MLPLNSLMWVRVAGEFSSPWRILSAGGDNLLKARGSRFVREGPSQENSTSGAVATLSELLADFSRELTEALKKTTLTSRDSPA